jgi:hypothetical protein
MGGEVGGYRRAFGRRGGRVKGYALCRESVI